MRRVGPAPESRTLECGYDAFGRASEETQTNPAGTVKRVITSYDTLDRVVATTDTRTGVATNLTYPVTAGADTVQTITYAGVTTTVTIDSKGLEKSRASGASFVSGGVSRTAGGRDGALRPTGWRVTLAGSALASATATYDEAGRLATLKAPGIDATATYSYDENGRKASETGTAGSSGLTSSLGATYTYGPDGRLMTSTAGGAVETASFDEAGSIKSVKIGPALPVEFAYDIEGRLGTMTASNDTTTYGWDPAKGWRTSSKRTGETSVTYSYTEGSRLSSVIDRNAGRETTATYQYDALGQRTTSVIVKKGSPSTTETRTWSYDGTTLLSVSSATSSTAATSTVWQVSYLYDEAGRPFAGLYREGTTILGSATPFAIATTDRGDVVSLVASNGAAFATYAYGAWGNPTGAATRATGSVTATLAAAIATRQPLRYAGYVFDAESGYYYCSARMYDPVTRQFTSKDPAKADGEESAYQYCGGDPVGAVDPSGARAGKPLLGTYWYRSEFGGWLPFLGRANWSASVDWSRRDFSVRVRYDASPVTDFWQGMSLVFSVEYWVGDDYRSRLLRVGGSRGISRASLTSTLTCASRKGSKGSLAIQGRTPTPRGRISHLVVHATMDLDRVRAGFWTPLWWVEPPTKHMWFTNPYGGLRALPSAHAITASSTRAAPRRDPGSYRSVER